MSELLERILSRNNMNAAYKRVCANKGAGWVDEVTVEELGDYIKENWEGIREQIRRRVEIPKSVRRVEIPKPAGGVRKLGISTVEDRIAQMVAKLYFEPCVEPIFCEDSYGYRPNRSAIQALETTRCWRKDWVLEFDIQELFRLRHAKNRYGEFFTNFLPAISENAKKAIRKEVRGWKLQLKSDRDFYDIVNMFNRQIQGWINYYALGFMKTAMTEIDAHLRTRLRIIIWKQWKVPKKRQWEPQKLGIGKDQARLTAYCGDRYCWVDTKTCVVRAIFKDVLAKTGLVNCLDYYTECHALK